MDFLVVGIILVGASAFIYRRMKQKKAAQREETKPGSARPGGSSQEHK